MLYQPERLKGVDPDLVTLAYAAGMHGDVTVVAGARTIIAEQIAIDQGYSKLKTPMDSKHVVGPGRPLALAVDLAPWAPAAIDWKNTDAFKTFGAQVKEWAANLNIAITWGGDWGWDYDHFQKRGSA